MKVPGLPQHSQPSIGWNTLVAYVVLIVTLFGVAARFKIDFLALAIGLVMIYALGTLLVKGLVEIGGAKLQDDEKVPLAFVSGVVLTALVGSASFVIWPARALFLTRILLGLAGTLLCAAVLTQRTRAGRMSTCVHDAKAPGQVNPYKTIVGLGLSLLIGFVVYLSSSQEGAEHYTELFLADSKTEVCSTAQSSQDGICIHVQIGVINREGQSVAYSLLLNTPSSREAPHSFLLRDGETYKIGYEFPARICEQEGNVDIALYIDGDPSPHRSLRLSCALLSLEPESSD